MKTIYSLSLHESLVEGNLKITRVPGGWIYLSIYESHISSLFVPMNKEYAPKEKQKKISFTFEDRMLDFKESIKAVARDIGFKDVDVLKGFFEYWSEKSVKGEKMKWELEKTFSVSKRLGTWIKNKDKFGSQETANKLKNFER